MEAIKVFIADDDASVVETIKLYFPHDHVTTETDPVKALSLIRANPYDLLFIDYVFSGAKFTGIEIFAEIKKLYGDCVYVGVIITSWGTSWLFMQEQASGLFSEYIEKPFSEFPNLHEKISNALALLKRKQEIALGKQNNLEDKGNDNTCKGEADK